MVEAVGVMADSERGEARVPVDAAEVEVVRGKAVAEAKAAAGALARVAAEAELEAEVGGEVAVGAGVGATEAGAEKVVEAETVEGGVGVQGLSPLTRAVRVALWTGLPQTLARLHSQEYGTMSNSIDRIRT